jgi:hypothetical protein
MASAYEAYLQLQQAINASGAEQQALVNQAKATLQESVESPETTVTSSSVPAWVDPDYSYNVDKPRKPNMREMMELIAGRSVEELYADPNSNWQDISRQASNLLYGSVGSNEDTRDFVAITAAATDPNTGELDAKKFVAATQIATSKMYGGTTVKYQSGGYETDEAGNTVIDNNGNPVELPPRAYIVGGNGTILRGFNINNVDRMTEELTTFGVQTVDWVGDLMNAMQQSGSFDQVQMQRNLKLLGDLQNTYNPWANYQDIWDMEGLITGIASFQDPFKIVFGQTQATTTDTGESQNLGVTEQTITPEGTTETDTQTVTQPTYDSTPQASEAVPVDPQQTMGTGVAGTGVYPQTGATTGTFSSPVQTGGLGAVPSTVQTYPNYTGTSMANLTSQSQQGFGGQRTYGNQFGQRIIVTVDGSGKPITYVPPGYTPVQGQAEGGSVSEGGPDVQLARRFLGFTGPASQLTNFLAANPAAAARMGKYQQAMSGMAQNKVGAQEGIVGTSLEDFQNMQGNLISQTMQPVQSGVQQIQPQEADFIGLTAGQATPVSPMSQVATVGNVEQAQMPMMTDTATMTPASVFEGVQGVTAANQAAQGTVSDEAQVTAAQQSTSAVSDLKAAQGTAIMMDNPVQREIQDGELISGYSKPL